MCGLYWGEVLYGFMFSGLANVSSVLICWELNFVCVELILVLFTCWRRVGACSFGVFYLCDVWW